MYGLIDNIFLYSDSLLIIISVFLCSLFLSTLYQPHKKKYNVYMSCLYRLLIIMPVAILVAIRGEDTGTDTHNLYAEFVWTKQLFAEELDITAALYSLYRYLVYILFGNNVIIFLFGLAVSSLYVVYYAIEKLSSNISFSYFIFLTCYGMQLMNQSRQMVAVSLVLLSFLYLKERIWVKYAICVLLATSIHATAMIASLFYLIVNFTYKSNRIYYLEFIVLILISYNLGQYINDFSFLFANTKYISYFEDVQNTSLGSLLFLVLLPTVFPVLLFKNKKEDGECLNKIIYLTLPMRILGYSAYFMYRMFYYFGMLSVISLPQIIDSYSGSKREIIKLLFVVICIVYFMLYYVGPQSSVYFPYTINSHL